MKKTKNGRGRICSSSLQLGCSWRHRNSCLFDGQSPVSGREYLTWPRGSNVSISCCVLRATSRLPRPAGRPARAYPRTTDRPSAMHAGRCVRMGTQPCMVHPSQFTRRLALTKERKTPRHQPRADMHRAQWQRLNRWIISTASCHRSNLSTLAPSMGLICSAV